MSWFRSWRLPLRLARREAARARGRSILVLVMIALPVLAVTAADVVIQTSDVSTVEGLDRRIGSADALVTYQQGSGEVFQDVDPVDSTSNGAEELDPLPDLAAVKQALGPGTTGITWGEGSVGVETAKGVADTEVSELDLRDPLADGIFDVTSGRPAAAPDEIAINQDLAARGFALGDELTVRDGKTYTVVGIGDDTSYRGYPKAVGLPGAFGIATDGLDAGFLVGGGPVSWEQVRALNAGGGLVLSRAVVLDPPPRSEIPDEITRFTGGGTDSATVAVVVLIAVMALIEVVLLAGPAFAVGARRQSRALALMAATGGTPRQARRVVLANGVVLGGLGALLGVVLGLVVAWLVLPIVQHFSTSWFGPYEVPWPHLAGIAAFGLLSALLAAVVPAWIASRQDVVAVLAGRRGDRRPSLRSPIVGLVLLGVGVVGAVLGAAGFGEFFIAGAAILAVLGMILLVPVVLVAVARLARRFPLTLRYAVRDAARHRSRTVPAVAAVAATVAGVVALGIGVTSDEAANVGTYVRSLPMGTGAVTDYDAGGTWAGLQAAVVRELPDATVTAMHGVVEGGGTGEASYYVDTLVPGATDAERDPWFLNTTGSALGASTLVGDDGLPGVLEVSSAARGEAAAMLRSGGAVVFTDRGVEADEVELVAHRWNPEGTEETVTRVTVPVLVVPIAANQAGPAAVLPTAVAKKLKVPVGTVGLSVTGVDVSDRQESDVAEALKGIDDNAAIYVERGYQADDETVVIQLVLAALGAVLMLGGTLTATFLALSDARADLATLAAVGAAPRTRRGVAAAYALVVGLVGAALGAVVGFIPGIAISYPLTSGYSDVDAHYLDIPWLLVLGLVVGLPVLTALVVGLTARSRLPLVARLD